MSDRYKTPEERAYRRGVGQTIAEILREWERSRPPSVEAALAQLRRLEARSRELRYTNRDVDLYLRELWAEERRPTGRPKQE